MSTEEEQETEEVEDDEDIRYFVRVGTTDLDGTKSVETALLEMNGVGRRVARAIADDVGVNPRETLGKLGDDDVESLKGVIKNFEEVGPNWMLNRERDWYTGEDRHVVGTDLEIVREEDINRMKKIRSYKGVRHEKGKKVRGQRTQSTGRSEGTVAVKVSELQEEAELEEEE